MPRNNGKTFNYKEDLEIDKDALDDELEQHVELCMDYGEHAAYLRKEAKKAHEKVKVIRSELMKECKENEPKATGPMIEAYYRTHKAHIDAKDEQIEAEYRADVMEVAANAFNFTRTKALSEFVRLWLRRFWDSPKIPFTGDLAIYDELRDRQRKGMNKKKN